VRLISATRKRLEDEVLAGRLREDLFYRLKVIPVVLPPLRDRKEDILPLAERFLGKYARPLGKDVRTIAPEACGYLLAHSWPGNVRELEASIQRAVTLTRNPMLTVEDLSADAVPGRASESGLGGQRLPDAMRETERRYLGEVLRNVGGQKQRAAEILGISRKTLWKKMKQLGLE